MKKKQFKNSNTSPTLNNKSPAKDDILFDITDSSPQIPPQPQVSPQTHPDLLDLDSPDVSDPFGDPVPDSPPPQPDSQAHPQPPTTAGAPPTPTTPPTPSAPPTPPTPNSQKDDLIDFRSDTLPSTSKSHLKHNLNC